MPFDLSPLTVATLAIALLGAAFVRGYSGFGFSAIFIACAALVTSPLPLIPVVFACEMVMTFFQAKSIRGHIEWRRVLPLLIGSAIALPIAVAVILSIGEDTVRIAISGMILVLSLVLLSGWTLQKHIGLVGHCGVGMICGICNGAGIGGLPAAAFMTAQPMPPANFRATMIVFLTGIDLMTLPLLWMGGLVTTDTFIGVGFALPLLGLGIWYGNRQFSTTSPTSFRKFAVFLLLILSSLGLIRVII